MAKVVEISNVEEFKKILADSKYVVINFTAAWCGPCKRIAPIVEKLAEASPDIKILRVDVDDLPSLAQEYGIQAMPTFVYLKEGKEIADLRVKGAAPQAIAAALKTLQEK